MDFLEIGSFSAPLIPLTTNNKVFCMQLP